MVDTEFTYNENKYAEIILFIDNITINYIYVDNKQDDIPQSKIQQTALFISVLDKEVIEKIKYYNAIVFDYRFTDCNNLINYLPNHIKYIVFDYESHFDKPIYNYPQLLEYIKFGIMFNQSIDYLPNTLKYLITGYHFNHHLYNIPNSIEYISLNSMFNYPINNLNDNIKVLYLNCDNFIHQILKLPKQLEHIILCSKTTIILDTKCFSDLLNLREIEFGYDFNSSLDNIKWSDSIQILKFGDNFNQMLNNLPKYLKKIQVGVDFDIFENIKYLPETITKFIYIDSYPKCIDKANRLKQLAELFPNIQFIHS